MAGTPPIGVIGGSGFYSLLEDAAETTVDTPYGDASAALTTGQLGGRDVVFVPRHGVGHRYAPHVVPYRANLWALRSLGVRQVLSLSAVGSLTPSLPPGALVVPDQVVDRTSGRAHTYFDAESVGVGHVSFADPYCPQLRAGAAGSGLAVATRGALVVVNGPRFSTRAESQEFQRNGWTVIGMTAMPEAGLARELALCYATLALVTDLDAGVEAGQGVTHEQVLAQFAANLPRLRELLVATVSAAPTDQRGCDCADLSGRPPSFVLPGATAPPTPPDPSPSHRSGASMPAVRLEHDGPLAVVTLASPPLNLFDRTMAQELADAVAQVRSSEARALLMRADGRAVSAGVDVHLFATLDTDSAAELWRDWFELVHAIEDLPMPTVFAAHALCLTAAFEISLACDVLVAAESARFGLVERVVGLTPSMGGPQRLAERAGPARAREIVYTGELFDAARLERWNIVNRVLPDDGFDAAARAFAMSLALGPTRAHAATKAIIREQVEVGTAGADEITADVSGRLFATEDLKNAVASFLADGPGKATFTGR